MKDSFDRSIDYVRIAVTDRCNLRCFYCMPANGIPYEPKKHLLSYEEIIRLLDVLGGLGFKKVRFTGGEPFLRKDFIKLLEKTVELGVYDSIHITSNGTLLQKHITRLKELGISKINLSIDSLDPERFHQITRRNDFEKVWQTFHMLVEHGFQIKLNAVIMHGINTQDIISLAELAKAYPVGVRFIEEMPFNGGYKQNIQMYSARDIHSDLKAHYPTLEKLPAKHGDTATVFQVPGYQGNLGVIAAFSRTFCNTCNRLRIASKGEIKSCLYDDGVFNIRDYMRAGVSDTELADKFREIIRLKPKDGFEAEKQRKNTMQAMKSMSSIGG
ncbi:GTP 3',8-cyclase MoaA [Flavobacteriaceae bacterium TP-CH-4]|uniref:GTP 3',8-cyclase n=1 Tax=Pelagihabitans pacificus TaxID=2696054 RepID=A0A967AVE0_9FLAO|nr:GTP 3',8-cyclase MoaA [Pelagihabitans pacificus]NHF59875.1 GTP 3',8-cyclase MoaA [Pelagihabitans pacificus]